MVKKNKKPPAKVTIQTKVDESDSSWLQAKTDVEGITVAAFVRRLIKIERSKDEAATST